MSSSYLDAIPLAVATIVSACLANVGPTRKLEDLAAAEKWAVELTDRLISTFAKGLREAETEK